MKYLLDSNTVSDIYNPSAENHNRFIKKILALKENDDIFISILTLYEFEYAFANAPTQKKNEIRATIWQMQQDFIVLPLSPTAAEIFGDLKKLFKELRNIKSENLKKHTIDLMATNLKRDSYQFQRVSHLPFTTFARKRKLPHLIKQPRKHIRKLGIE
jgi:predicted nucleic acid-binding protein